METALIALDWGTTSFRGYRLDHHGAILEKVQLRAGILQTTEADFEASFERLLAPWLAASATAPIIAAGMITSKQGWIETGYASCPATLADFAGMLRVHTTRRGRNVHFVPGLTLRHAGGVPDVIRGEETQVMGLLGKAAPPGLLILPGTHSKWLTSQGQTITWFATFMTGEIFTAIKEHTIIGKLIGEGPPDREAFLEGVAYIRRDGQTGGLLHKLFSARTLPLFDRLRPDQVASYLSGLMIGSEIVEGLVASRRMGPLDATLIVGDAALADLYVQALQQFGVESRRAQEDCAAQGLWRMARAAGLMD